MTDETTSWLIDRQTPTSPGTYGVVEFEEGQPYEHVGVLVPDGRLQAIADVPRCEHGKIDRHYDLPEGQWLDEGIWCEGAPELRSLLAALTEDNGG